MTVDDRLTGWTVAFQAETKAIAVEIKLAARKEENALQK